jgi:DNA-binding winged helix-turn-helix (wHTH) protein
MLTGKRFSALELPRDAMIYTFGDCELHTRLYTLRRNGVTMRLRPRVYQVLTYLLEHRDRVVSKDELCEQVWSNLSISNAALESTMRLVRRAVGDSGRTQKIIQTVHGWGYRFICPLTRANGHPVDTSPTNAKPSPAPAPASPLIVGREAELRQLHQGLQQACRGERHVIFVTGEPGIGKTALVDAFAAQVTTGDSLWLGRGQCVEHYGVGEPCGPIFDALSQLCRTPARGQISAVLRRYAPMGLVQMPWLVDNKDYEALQHRLSSTRPEGMVRELAEALEVLTQETPLVLILEDLHWSDVATLEMLDVLARRRDPARLLVVGTYRPMEVYGKGHPLHRMTQELCVHSHCVDLPLPSLSVEAVQAYLAARFPGRAWLEDLALQLYYRTEGNPLFFVEVIEHLLNVDSSSVLAEQGAWNNARRVEAVIESVPAALQQMIGRHLTQILPEELRVLEVGSVIGDTFTAAAVSAGLEVETEQAEAWCKGLIQRRCFLDSRGSERWLNGTVSERYGFIHTFYREVVYNQVPAAQRLRYHRRVSRWLEQGYSRRERELVVDHARHCEPEQEDLPAVSYRPQAAGIAHQRRAAREGVVHLTPGLELIEVLPGSRMVKNRYAGVVYAPARARGSLPPSPV